MSEQAGEKPTIDQAKELFMKLSENDRLRFIRWCRAEADKDTYLKFKDEVEALKDDVSNIGKEVTSKTAELSEKASETMQKGVKTLDRLFGSFLGSDKPSEKK